MFLTVCSLFFYAWGEPIFVFVMIGSILGNWAFALWVDKVRNNKTLSKIALILTVLTNLSVLFIYKYLAFTFTSINNIFSANIIIPQIILPIGISFFTFQAMSYVFDVNRQNGDVQKNPLNVALYISFFPQLIAGPIVRYETIAKQIKHRKETLNDFVSGIYRFIIGLAKKVIIANHLALVSNFAFENYNSSVAMAWLGIIAYTFQIFYDFCGYSDMAIGLGKMFGFHFLENFNYPYVSKSISEFWRRWHISLGTWFRDYVYLPLGGSRTNKTIRLIFNLFVVWILTGIWHGANWTFFIWGLMYFALITLEKTTGFYKKLGWFNHIYTMAFVIIGWVIFRSNSLPESITYLGNMIGIGTTSLIDNKAIFYFNEYKFFYLFALLFAIPIAPWLSSKIKNNKLSNSFNLIAVILLFLVSVAYIVKGSYNPFIYFNF